MLRHADECYGEEMDVPLPDQSLVELSMLLFYFSVWNQAHLGQASDGHVEILVL
jgi:hypothetical protein